MKEKWIEQTVDSVIDASNNNVQEAEKMLEEIRIRAKRKIEESKGIQRPVIPQD